MRTGSCLVGLFSLRGQMFSSYFPKDWRATCSRCHRLVFVLHFYSLWGLCKHGSSGLISDTDPCLCGPGRTSGRVRKLGLSATHEDSADGPPDSWTHLGALCVTGPAS